MERRITSWYSPNLGMEMPLVAYGHSGYPLLMFPTAAADFLEYERFYLVDSIKHHIEAGRLRAYSINSVNRYSLLNDKAPPHIKGELLTRYDRYITDEVLPLIRNDAGDHASDTGASLGPTRGKHLLPNTGRCEEHPMSENNIRRGRRLPRREVYAQPPSST